VKGKALRKNELHGKKQDMSFDNLQITIACCLKQGHSVQISGDKVHLKKIRVERL